MSTADPDALALISRLPWRAARPQPWGLHEYTVRNPETEADYTALFGAIQRDGIFERWAGRRKRYLYPGDGRKYWAMSSELRFSRIINRMLATDDRNRLRREGQLPRSC
jgi:hypothetical protein